ncbi:hypothetical protein E2C01_073793 [Portunus trituberculatus]|uniref:Uncharacterized protein n=1 Tax=Portunus trituberculatus TaxID=210409 RepID=A0A5B7IAM8_PORTR|nr:hypothetical protein [Portunus trituberculatus]
MQPRVTSPLIPAIVYTWSMLLFPSLRVCTPLIHQYLHPHERRLLYAAPQPRGSMALILTG